MINKKDFIMQRLLEHYMFLVTKGYEVVCLMLQGSQNYGLDEYSNEYKSDIDSKAIVLPHFQDFVYGQPPVTITEILPNNEHIDVKDIRVMFEMFKKQNVSYIELLYTDYKLINNKYIDDINILFNNKEKIAAINRNQFLKCIQGMAGNKLKALCHPYPTLIDKINIYGFDGKQLSHCIRLFEFVSRYLRGVPIADCYWTQEPQMLINLKKQLDWAGDRVLKKDEAVAACSFYYKQVELLVKLNLTKEDVVNKEGIEILDNLKYILLKRKFMEDILDDKKTVLANLGSNQANE